MLSSIQLWAPGGVWVPAVLWGAALGRCGSLTDVEMHAVQWVILSQRLLKQSISPLSPPPVTAVGHQHLAEPLSPCRKHLVLGADPLPALQGVPHYKALPCQASHHHWEDAKARSGAQPQLHNTQKLSAQPHKASTYPCQAATLTSAAQRALGPLSIL